MHSCDDVKKQLWAFLMEETDPEINQKIQMHLQGCPSCQKECEALQKVQAAMETDVSSSMPEDFAETLHLKLMAAAEEMKAPTLWERFYENLQRVRRYGAWKTVAPALVCLVLVVGVFSSGLYESWQKENPILSPTPTATPVVTATAEPTSTPLAETPIPIQTPNVVSVPVTIPTPEVSAPAMTEEPITSVPEPAISAENVPAPASMEAEPQPAYPGTAYDLPRHRADLYQISISAPDVFLDGWQENWRQYKQEPEEFPGLDDASILLELPQTAFQSFKTYAQENGIDPQTFSQEENQDKTLVLITGNEE